VSRVLPTTVSALEGFYDSFSHYIPPSDSTGRLTCNSSPVSKGGINRGKGAEGSWFTSYYI